MQEWDHYTQALKLAHIQLVLREDDLIWDLHLSGVYTLKVGYIQLSEDQVLGEEIWWWRRLWKFKCMAKSKLLLWAILKNKVPTWDNLRKRTFNGPGWCTLWRMEEEFVSHLFLNCSYTKATWEEAGNI